MRGRRATDRSTRLRCRIRTCRIRGWCSRRPIACSAGRCRSGSSVHRIGAGATHGSTCWPRLPGSTPISRLPRRRWRFRSGLTIGPTLLVIVDEGDNRPLPITAVRLLLPSWRLRFFRPAGPLKLIYGKDEVAAPEYDLALLAPAVMGSEARDLSAEAEQTASSTPPAVLSPRLFWIGLGIAVAVLLGLIVRLISSATEPPPSPPAP